MGPALIAKAIFGAIGGGLEGAAKPYNGGVSVQSAGAKTDNDSGDAEGTDLKTDTNSSDNAPKTDNNANSGSGLAIAKGVLGGMGGAFSGAA